MASRFWGGADDSESEESTEEEASDSGSSSSSSEDGDAKKGPSKCARCGAVARQPAPAPLALLETCVVGAVAARGRGVGGRQQNLAALTARPAPLRPLARRRYMAGGDSDSDSDDGKRVVRSAKARVARSRLVRAATARAGGRR